MSVNNFDVLKEMGKRSMNIQLAPLGNITNMRMVKAGTQITIGVAGNVIGSITLGEFVGGLILADKAQFEQIKAELEAAIQSPVNSDAQPESGAQGEEGTSR